jgi:hypothetical protein
MAHILPRQRRQSSSPRFRHQSGLPGPQFPAAPRVPAGRPRVRGRGRAGRGAGLDQVQIGWQDPRTWPSSRCPTPRPLDSPLAVQPQGPRAGSCGGRRGPHSPASYRAGFGERSGASATQPAHLGSGSRHLSSGKGWASWPRTAQMGAGSSADAATVIFPSGGSG